MNKQSDWDPDHYLKFRDERTQPSIDLVNRIYTARSPNNIIDIGCGPGNSSKILLQRWPKARLIGIDNSPAMIEKAKKDHPDQEWILADAAGFSTEIQFDVVFSNAAIQWIPDHKTLFKNLYKMLSENGIVAIQVPRFREMALGRLIDSVSQKDRWKNIMEGCSGSFTYHDHRFYYDLLAGGMRSMDIWETDYVHVMPSHLSIVDWIKGTGLKPYLDRARNEQEKKEFEEEILDEIKKAYPGQQNGQVLFPFKRLFFIGYK